MIWASLPEGTRMVLFPLGGAVPEHGVITSCDYGSHASLLPPSPTLPCLVRCMLPYFYIDDTWTAGRHQLDMTPVKVDESLILTGVMSQKCWYPATCSMMSVC